MTEFPGVVPAIAHALTKRGYAELTPVQKAVLDTELNGADALVSAQTGSGKTVAFGLALAPTLLGDKERFGPARAPLALAVAPTRELALQVKRELEWLYEMTGAKIASCVGGMDMRTERRALEQGAHIVVGTPGRLRDHITRNSLDMSAMRAVVLDEADEMLDLGFREDLEFILESAPAERRTLMFSATVPKAIAKLAESYQKNAVRIATSAEQKQHVDIEYRALMVSTSDRENAIINVLRFYEAKTALVFCATRAAVNHMTARFNNRGFSVVALSGELSQNERTHALQAMRDGRARVLIATDVAARGIDLPNLELVIHADLPTNPETLLHRSGRTGRAGRKGVSVLVVPGNARRKAERILQGANIRAEWARPPSADEILRRDDERLLADPTFDEAVGDEEKPFIAELLARHGAEKIAAAFVRLYRGGRSAPEELIETGPITAAKDTPYAIQPRDDFKDGRWFTLSVGRKQSAEPRWLIPLLCRIGSITKREIGAIKMMQEETLVELAGNCVDGFLAKIGPEGNLENGITIKAMEGKPDFSSPAFKRDYEKDDGERVPYKDRNPYAKKPAGEKKAYGDKKPWADKKVGGDRKPFGDKKPWAPRAGDQPQPAARPVKTFEQKRAEKSSEQVSLEAADREVWSSGPGKKDYGSPKSAKPAFDKPKTEKPKAKRQNAKNRAE